MPRTAMLLVMHDSSDPKARDALAKLRLAAGDGVEVEELDALHVVALIAPADLENPPTEEPNG